MKEIIEKINKNSLIAGILGTIIFIYFLEPVFGFLGKFLTFVFKYSSKNLYDRLFEEIALGKPDYSYVLIMSINISVLSLLFFISVKPFKTQKNKSENNALNEDETLKEKRKNLSSYFRVISFVLFIVILISTVLSDVKLKTIQSFEQKIKIITPYIDQHSKEIIISDFSRMKSSEDYDKIIKTINSIASKEKIILPKTKNHIF